MGRIIDGRSIAKGIRTELKQEIERSGLTPTLAVISVGHDDASEVYIRQKEKAADMVGISFQRHHFETSTTTDLQELLTTLNIDPLVHGILVQLPLPPELDERKIMEGISPGKDVDGFHPVNYGKLLMNEPCFVPCTPGGIMTMLDHEGVVLEGKDVVIVNHSNIVGKPLSLLMLNRNATVTVCHIFTDDLASHTQRADILITAAGVPDHITSHMVREGAVVIDVSMNRVDGKLCGDVRFEEVKEKASLITPVPGGVGPMTVITLMQNTYQAALGNER